MRARHVLRVVLATAVLIGALWWVLSGVNLSLTFSIIGQSDVIIILLCVPIILLSHVVRASRWRTMLTESSQSFSLGTAYNAVMIGYAANTIVPRSGEVIRPWVFAKRSGISVSTSLASVIVERLLDVLTLLLGIGLVLLFEGAQLSAAIPSLSTDVITYGMGLPALVLAVIVAIVAFTDAGQRVVTQLLRPLGPRVTTKIVSVLDGLHRGTSILRRPSLWLRAIVETILLWSLYIVPLYILLQAIPFQPELHTTFLDAAVMLVIISVGVTIAPTPGALGIYQGFAQAALVRIHGVDESSALAFGVLAWVVNYGVALLAGGLSAFLEMRNGLSWSDVRESSTS